MSDDLIVIARNAEEMAKAQADLTAWAETKATAALADRAEIQESLDVATRSKWGTKGLRTGLRLAQQRHEFYRKIALATKLGYVIVPNFPVDVFAIRTNKGKPIKGTNKGRWSTHEQTTEAPPVGEGNYVNAIPEIKVGSYTEKAADGRDINKQYSWAHEFRDVEFPLRGVKPAILDDTARAMVVNVFDDLGISPAGMLRRRSFDPMVIGRIHYRPRKHVISFLVAWWMSNRDIEIR